MSCDLQDMEGEIKMIEGSIAAKERDIQTLEGDRELLADLLAKKKECEAAAKKPAGTGVGVGAKWAASHSGTAPIVASHRSGAVGKGTSNTGVFSGLLGGRRTRRSKAKRSKSRKMRR